MRAPRQSQGFTLFEIMIALIVVVVLLGVALPAYESYSIRARVSECINLATPAQLAVTDRVMRDGSVPGSSTEAGFDFSETEFCDDVRVAGDGTVVIETQNTGAPEDPVVQFRMNLDRALARVDWDCETVAGDPAHVPSRCRGLGTPPPAGTDSGSDDSGGGNAGGGDSGGGDSGDGDSGDGDSGDGDSGDGDSGDGGNSGGGNSGGGNSGGGNSGGGNSGGGNSGGGNSGGGNSGGGNSGGGNSGGGSSGGGSSGGGSSGGGSSGGGNSGGGNSGGGNRGGNCSFFGRLFGRC